MFGAPILVTCAAAALLAACSTNGLAWVAEVERPPSASEGGGEPTASSMPEETAPAAQNQTTPEAPQRLRQTVTLGETDAPFDGSPSRANTSAPAAAADSTRDKAATPPVVYPYSTYDSYFWAAPPVRRVTPPRAVTPREDPRERRDVGPPFPFRTAPASPWAPAR